MELKSLEEIRHATAALATGNGDALDRLVWTGVFGTGELRDHARSAVLKQASTAGIYPASIHGLYTARGRRELPANFTVPAFNIRGMAYDTARAASLSAPLPKTPLQTSRSRASPLPVASAAVACRISSRFLSSMRLLVSCGPGGGRRVPAPGPSGSNDCMRSRAV